MSTFPGSPRLLKAAIIGVDPISPLASIAVFRYHSDTMTRTLQAQAASDGGARTEAVRLTGAPFETIKLKVETDAMKGRHL